MCTLRTNPNIQNQQNVYSNSSAELQEPKILEKIVLCQVERLTGDILLQRVPAKVPIEEASGRP